MTAPLKRWNLTRRLILILTAALGGLWFLAVVASTLVTLHEVNEVFRQRTGGNGAAAGGPGRAHHYRDDDGEYESDLSEPENFGDHEEYLIYQVRDAKGRVLLRSHDAPAEPFAAPLEPGMTNVDGMRVLTESTRDRRLFVQVAERDEHRYEAARGTLLLLLLLLLRANRRVRGGRHVSARALSGVRHNPRCR